MYVELLGDNTASFTFGELPDVLFDDVAMLKGFGVGDVFCFGDRCVFLLFMASVGVICKKSGYGFPICWKNSVILSGDRTLSPTLCIARACGLPHR